MSFGENTFLIFSIKCVIKQCPNWYFPSLFRSEQTQFGVWCEILPQNSMQWKRPLSVAMGRPTALEHNWDCVEVLASPCGRTRSEMRPLHRPETNMKTSVTTWVESFTWDPTRWDSWGDRAMIFLDCVYWRKEMSGLKNPIWTFSSKPFYWFHATQRLS